MQGYKISLDSVRSINRTINSVNRMQTTGASGRLPFRQNQKGRASGSGAVIQYGKTMPYESNTFGWRNGSIADIIVYELRNGSYEQKLDAAGDLVIAENVYNPFGLVLPDSWVQWQTTSELGSIRTDSHQEVILGKTEEDWPITKTQRIVPIDQDGIILITYKYEVLNLFADVKKDKWVAFMPNIYSDAILISAECD